MSNGSGSRGKEIASQAEEQIEYYECKYCSKRFSNKQALGGHQNAHKVERSMAKDGQDVQKNQFGYYVGHSSYSLISSPYAPGSYYGSQELINRSLPNPRQAYYAPYPPRPRLNPPAPQPGWNATVISSRVPQFAPRFPTMGNGGSNVRPDAPFVGGSRVLQNNNEGAEDSELDLELKL